ncbi:MAG: hypothetical protein K6B75_08260 [Lachnospiraceae bacterium]|nr:hypothetical protein [Lachnospiraceae bacterium]
MPEKIEQIMKKLNIDLANCKESTYSSEDVIVSKKRLIELLNELNIAVYEVMEQYEGTVAARERGQAEAERNAAIIKDEALKRAEDINASSLLYTQRAITDMQRVFETAYVNTKKNFEALMNSYQDQMDFLASNSVEMTSQLEAMTEGNVYLRIIEDMKKKKEEEDKKQNSKSNESVGEDEVAYEDEYTKKMSASAVVEVHETPKVPEGFGKKNKKKGRATGKDAAALESQNLDAEYFAFRKEQDSEEEKSNGGTGFSFFSKKHKK